MMTPLTDLDEFISLADTGKLFDKRTNSYFSTLRSNLRFALRELLFHQRPETDRMRGIASIYDLFNQRQAWFESLAHAHAKSQPADPFIVKQAALFLAMLPFPDQWQWIEQASSRYDNDSEVRTFLNDESNRIQRKIDKKKNKSFHLIDFCQILKPPALPHEKGVLRIFSIPYLFFSVPELLKQISQHYFLYVEPAAGINFRHEWLRVYTTLEDPVLFGLSSPEDRSFIGSQKGVLTTALAHGDYLMPLSVPSLNTPHSPPLHQKRYDIIFNNTFDERDRKRHALMLELMYHPRLKDCTVLFLGRGSENNVKDFKQEIEKRGITERTDVIANIKRKEVPGYLAQCRVGVHLALQENGCRAVYEYLRSDIPCVISNVTAGMNMEIITPETGAVVRDEALAETIREMIDKQKRGEQYRPAAWFEKHSGAFHSSQALNMILKKHFEALGYSWQRDIVPLTSSGLGRYADKSDYDALQPHFNDLMQLFLQEKNMSITLM